MGSDDEGEDDDEGLELASGSELGSDQEQPEAASDDEQGSDQDELEAVGDDEQQAYAEGQSGSDAESKGDEDEDAEDLSASAGASGSDGDDLELSVDAGSDDGSLAEGSDVDSDGAHDQSASGADHSLPEAFPQLQSQAASAADGQAQPSLPGQDAGTSSPAADEPGAVRQEHEVPQLVPLQGAKRGREADGLPSELRPRKQRRYQKLAASPGYCSQSIASM